MSEGATVMRWLLLLISLASSAWADQGHNHELTEEEIGSVHFTTSCSQKTQAQFNHAVALLHSFQYEQSREVFSSVATQEPTCAMAYWGVAMTHYHGLWANGDTAAGRAALQKARSTAQANAKTSTREKQYIEALGEIYVIDDRGEPDHARGFEQKMA